MLVSFRKKKSFKAYDQIVEDLNLEKDGRLRYAQWQHPGEGFSKVRQENVDFYREYISEGDFVIDIGANTGDTTVPMALAAGKSGLTLALEPNPHSYKVLALNATLNREKTNIQPLNFAATSHDGEFTFGSGDASYGNGGIVGFTYNEKANVRYTLQVNGKNLQNYLNKNYSSLLPRLKFIKIDAEGYDKEILKTIGDIIDRYKPVLVTECFGPSRDEEKKELFDLLVGHGYEVFRIAGLFTCEKESITAADLHGKKTFDILALPKK